MRYKTLGNFVEETMKGNRKLDLIDYWFAFCLQIYALHVAKTSWTNLDTVTCAAGDGEATRKDAKSTKPTLTPKSLLSALTPSNTEAL